jgi:hypothetical protein
LRHLPRIGVILFVIFLDRAIHRRPAHSPRASSSASWFDLDSLLTVDGVSLEALFLALLLVMRGASALIWLRRLGGRGTATLALFGATGLPLIVAIVGIAQERRRLLCGRGVAVWEPECSPC